MKRFFRCIIIFLVKNTVSFHILLCFFVWSEAKIFSQCLFLSPKGLNANFDGGEGCCTNFCPETTEA